MLFFIVNQKHPTARTSELFTPAGWRAVLTEDYTEPTTGTCNGHSNSPVRQCHLQDFENTWDCYFLKASKAVLAVVEEHSPHTERGLPNKQTRSHLLKEIRTTNKRSFSNKNKKKKGITTQEAWDLSKHQSEGNEFILISDHLMITI